jgi:hypothetical protein
MAAVLSFLAAAGLGASAVCPSAMAGGDPVVYENDFSAGLGGWEFWSDILPGEPHSYTGTIDSSIGSIGAAAHVQGDWDTHNSSGSGATGRNFGLQRSFPGLLRFHLTFDWRAWSATTSVTRMLLELVQDSDGTVLYQQYLIRGSTEDTGWLTFPPTDLSFALPSAHTDTRVRLSVGDLWHSDRQQHIAFDNVRLIATQLPPAPDPPVDLDDFSSTTDPWVLWRESTSFSPTYALEQDVTNGDPTPSARVMGSYDYSGSTRRYGLERTVPVVLPFVVEFDYATQDASSVTFQLVESDGTLRHTVQMEVPDGSWQHHAAVNLSGNVAGLAEVGARLWIVGTDNDNPDNALWVDNFSWTQPCATTLTYYEDSDGDGHGNPWSTHPYGDMCYPLSGWVADASDCDDGQAESFPGNDEVCDGLDNDCDPSTDEYLDEDGDLSPSCPDEDCNDTDSAVYPGAEELCNGLDDDCDPATDLDGTDRDSDGDGIFLCAGDCDDEDPESWPGAPENCDDEVDQDCDGTESLGETDPDCPDEDEDEDEDQDEDEGDSGDGVNDRGEGCNCSVGGGERRGGILLLVGAMCLWPRRRRVKT